ncbi:MAG: choice-of-anchor tandem repeat GloVer-containing protein [Vulcanimicrobiaceae bacterium]
MRLRALLIVAILGAVAAFGRGAFAAQSSHTIYAFGNPAGEFGLPASPQDDGEFPKGTLRFVPAVGRIFGTTAAGGNESDCGTYFSIQPDGGDYQVVFRFSGNDGCSPRHDAFFYDADDRSLFGATQGHSNTGHVAYNDGQVLRLDPTGGAPQLVHAFKGSPSDGAEQHSAFATVPGSTLLFGQTAKGGRENTGLLYAVCPDGSCFYPLHDFAATEGDTPHGGLRLVGTNFWGMTRRGGPGGGGSVFFFPLQFANGVPQPGPITVVHYFTGHVGDGFQPEHGTLTPVTQKGRVVLYGLTKLGGTGDGVILQVDVAAQRYSTFYQFHGNVDGRYPYGTLRYDAASGYLYGTTSSGGTFGLGTVFRVKPAGFGSTGKIEPLYQFSGTAGDGAKPIDTLIVVGGRLYGVTVYGGTSQPSSDGTKHTGDGTIFALPLPQS